MRKYFYIDDEDEQTIQSIAEGVSASKHVEIDVVPLKDNRAFESLTDFLKTKWDQTDGFLLDLKLNGTGPNNTKFSATSLAQWLRSYAVENDKPHKPIVLLSNDLKCAHYSSDVTSHDLFDIVIERTVDLPWEPFSIQLAILADTYSKLNGDKEKNLQNIFQYGNIDATVTMLAPFVKAESFNVSRFAMFVLHDLFEHSGWLIDEAVLAARLGVDKDKSGNEWEKFRDTYFSEAQYKGDFAELKRLYWSKETIGIFKKVTGGKSPASMTGPQRLEAMKATVNEAKNLISYQPEGHCKSVYYWTVDEVTKKPLDASEGYMIQEETGLKAWQEPRYVCFDTIENGHLGDFELMPSEQERYEMDLASMKD